MNTRFIQELDDVLPHETVDPERWRLAKLAYEAWLDTPLAQSMSVLNQKLELLRRAVAIFTSAILHEERVIEAVTRDLHVVGDEITIPVHGRSEVVRVADVSMNEQLEVMYTLERTDGSRFRHTFVD